MSKRRVFGLISLPGWILLIGGGVITVVDVLSNVDWILDLGQNKRVQQVWQFLLTPVGRLITLVAGIVWLVVTVLARTAGHRSDHGELEDAAASPGVAGVGEARAIPERPIAAGLATADPEPNVIVLSCEVLQVEFRDDLSVYERGDGRAKGATVTFRNDPVKVRATANMDDTRALLTVTPNRGAVVHVAAGHWLRSGLNCVDFGVGDTNTLVIALQLPALTCLATMDDPRELNTVERVRAVQLSDTMTTARVHVKLVGGFRGRFVEEFDFELTVNPLDIRPI